MTNSAGIAGIAALAFLLGDPSAARAAEGSVEPVKIVDDTTLELSSEALANLSLTAVSAEDFPDVLSIMGSISVVENRVSSVPARVAGRIDSVLKVTGEYVKAGDALALEYSPDFIATRQEYIEALKKQNPAETDFSSLAAMTRKKLENMGLIAADIEALAGSADETHLVVRAGRDGAITAVNTAVGNMQNQGDVLMTIADLDRVWFSGDLYSEDLAKVHPGQRIRIGTEGLSAPLEGEISFISPVIDANAHTIKVRAMIANPGRALRGGMVVQGDVVLSKSRALVVPEGALLNLHNSFFCFKKVGDTRLKEVPVKVAREYAGRATVVEGLAEGDEVVSAGGLVLDQAFQGD